jgi:thiol-disulfide isomerase/thioredoxin
MGFFNKSFFLGILTGVFLTLTLLVGSVVLGGIWLASALGGKRTTAMLPPPPFPSAAVVNQRWAVRSLDGRLFDLSQARGRVVFLNCWATWCGPCVAEMPGMQRLYDVMKTKEIVFLFVSQETPEKVRRFIHEKGLTLPIYTATGAPPAAFQTKSIPATFILSRDGRIAFQHNGSARWDDRTSVDFLNRLLQ